MKNLFYAIIATLVIRASIISLMTGAFYLIGVSEINTCILLAIWCDVVGGYLNNLCRTTKEAKIMLDEKYREDEE